MSHHWTPSLVATATAVGVTAVGYGLGRPEQQPPDAPAQKRKQSSDLLDSFMPSRMASPSPITPLGISSLPQSMNVPTSSGAGRLSYDGRTSSGKVRRMQNSDAPTQRRTDNERITTPGSDTAAEFGPRLTLRSRPSWMKRMSMSASRNSSPSSSPRPESPTISNSNGSAAFSNTGSMVPTVGGRPITPLPPNKLVKRASSTPLVSGSLSNSRLSSIRRPATSHQRQSILLQNSTFQNTSNQETISPNTDSRQRRTTNNDTSWKQYFSVRLSKSSAFSRRYASHGDNKGIKRVLPDSRYYPTLVTTKSVVTSTLDVDDFPDYDDDSVFFGSRPPSAFGLDSLSFTPGRMSLSAENPAAQMSSPAQGNTPAEAPPRRSFSLHDLLSLGPSRKESTRKAQGGRLTKKAGRRVVSEPISNSRNSSSLEPPAKRRDITDPSIFEKGILESMDVSQLSATDPLGRTEPPLPNGPFTFASHEHSQPFLGNLKLDQISHSPILPQASTGPSNYSTAPSEQTSTLTSSSPDIRAMGSSEEEGVDMDRDTVFDSTRTRKTRSRSSLKATNFETIIDESPPPQTTSNKLVLQEILPTGMFLSSARDHSVIKSNDIIEEEESVGTPVRTVRSDRADDGSPIAHRRHARLPPPLPLTIPSSPPNMAKPLNLGTLEYDDPAMEDDEESRWSCFDEDDETSLSDREDWDVVEEVATPLSIQPGNPLLVAAGSSSSSAPQQQQQQHLHPDSAKDTKSNIFDWSEQPLDKSPGNRSPPRPKTVHGKKDTDGRGSRTKGRRAPSGLHVRSQSVPVVPDLAGKRETVITNKFGTWGVGSKGVSEDWDEDFDFGESLAPANAGADRDERRIDSGIVMHIPQVIREQQANVMNNIGLVREFGILIEELKGLRARSALLGLVDGLDPDLWVQIDSMIDLADQEVEDPAIPAQLSPPSSPGFDMAAFEELAELPAKDRPRRKSGRSVSGRHQAVSTVTPTNLRKSRKSVLPLDNDVFSGPASSVNRGHHTPPSVASTRPRRDSEAVARSVIEALKKQRRSDPSLALQPVPSSKKVPFDTTTLRHIVPYVNSLVRKVKVHLREAEGFDISRGPSPGPEDPHDQPDPPFSKLFKDQSPGASSPSSRKGRPPRSNNKSTDDSFQTLDDINNKMKMMTVM